MKAALLLIIGFISLSMGTREASVRISGRMMCHGKPAQYVELQLVNDRTWPLSNTKMTSNVFTDPSGYFEIAGYENEASLDARLYIWHKCFEKPNEQKDPCSNWFQIEVPKIYIQNGILPLKTWKLGEIRLDRSRGGQKLDKCK